MPLVAGVVGVQPADHHGARAIRGGVVGHAEMHRLQPAPGGGDRLDIGHAERRLDQRLKADPVVKPGGLLDLADHGLDGVEIGRHAHLGHEDGVDMLAGLFHDLDHVAIHVMGVEPVDPDRHGLALGLPVDVVERLMMLARA